MPCSWRNLSGVRRARYTVGQFELFDSWVEAFMADYRMPECEERPTVAVTDFAKAACSAISTVHRGVQRAICAFRRCPAFEFDGEHLLSSAVEPSRRCGIPWP